MRKCLIRNTVHIFHFCKTNGHWCNHRTYLQNLHFWNIEILKYWNQMFFWVLGHQNLEYDRSLLRYGRTAYGPCWKLKTSQNSKSGQKSKRSPIADGVFGFLFFGPFGEHPKLKRCFSRVFERWRHLAEPRLTEPSWINKLILKFLAGPGPRATIILIFWERVVQSMGKNLWHRWIVASVINYYSLPEN